MDILVDLKLGYGGLLCRAKSKDAELDCIEKQGQTLVVVGGGAAGVYGAIWAKTACPQLKVLVLEKGHFLSKVKISGGGRCNVTTGRFFSDDPAPLAEQYPRGHKDLRDAYFRVHGPRNTAAWFEEHGVQLKTEEDGRMFPVTNDSLTVVNCLLNEARKLGVSLQSRTHVKNVESTNGHFEVQFKSKLAGSNEIQADFLLLATGSAAEGYDLARKLGHDLIPPNPSLFTFKVADSMLRKLAGIAFENVRVELELRGSKKRNPNFTQEGPLLITHWGLSGPAVLRLSAWAARELFEENYNGNVYVDFVSDLKMDEVEEILELHKFLYPSARLERRMPPAFRLPQRFWEYLIQRFWEFMLHRQNIKNRALWRDMSKQELDVLAVVLKRCAFEISGKGEFKDEFVTAGGVPLNEVNLETMQSKKCPRLYLAGELLNVDGITGGFNFQNAWTSGYLAGSAIGAEASRNSRA